MAKIDIFKKINRNAFNEKLIHRYLFERYYFGTSKQRRDLLPERFHKNQINLIVPEDAKVEDKYRADLTIYFKNRKAGIPVEVKWSSGGFTKRNQIDYIKNNDGFLVILGDTIEKQIHGVDIIAIKHDDFSDWIAENISRLSRESLIYQAESKKLADKNQYWVVFLRGGVNGAALLNFKRMLEVKSAKPFWAFKQDRKALSHVLDMQRGDKLFFIFSSVEHGAMGHSEKPDVKINVHRYYLTEIVEPYYMALDEKRGLFFEDKDVKPTIGDRKWPHFIDFDIKKFYDKETILPFGKQGEFGKAFAFSTNHGGGTPYPISRAQFEKLKDYLNKIK